MSMIAYLLRVSASELETYQKDSRLLKERVADKAGSSDPHLYDIDQSWDGIIYLLTGNNATDNTHPLANILFSGQLIDEAQDMGYGPAHYLDPQQVKALHEQLEAISPDQLRNRFNAEAMKITGVYPNAWDYEGTDDYLIEYFETIQDVFVTAAQREEGLITFLA